VEVIPEKNDILRELVIKPGELLMVDDPEAVMNRDGTLVNQGRNHIRFHGTCVTI